MIDNCSTIEMISIKANTGASDRCWCWFRSCRLNCQQVASPERGGYRHEERGNELNGRLSHANSPLFDEFVNCALFRRPLADHDQQEFVASFDISQPKYFGWIAIII